MNFQRYAEVMLRVAALAALLVMSLGIQPGRAEPKWPLPDEMTTGLTRPRDTAGACAAGLACAAAAMPAAVPVSTNSRRFIRLDGSGS